MKPRSVRFQLYAHPYDMGGLPIRQPFPTVKVEQIDPFLLLHHAVVDVPEEIDPDHAGVGPHPHRGFSPVTFIFKGGVHHRDSRGNDSVIYEGGAQWTNAGMGIIHSERPPKDIHQIGGKQEIIQLWINAPAKNKMDQPSYIPVKAEDAGKIVSDDQKVTGSIFSGEVLGVKGPITPSSPVTALTLSARAGGKIFISLSQDHNVFLYVLNGKITIDGYGLTEELNALVFKDDGDGIGFSALEDSTLLLMSGKPLNEEVVHQGPFVMNTQSQILEAMRDYQMGKMGVLIEE